MRLRGPRSGSLPVREQAVLRKWRALLDQEEGALSREAIRQALGADAEELRTACVELAEALGAARSALGRYRTLIDHLPQAILITDPEGLVHEANRQAGELFRAPVSDLVGRSIMELVEDTSLEDLLECLSMPQGGAVRELGLRTLCGEPLRAGAEVIEVCEPGEPTGPLVWILGKREARPAEAAPTRSALLGSEAPPATWATEESWRTLVDNVPDSIALLDPEGTILFTNYAFPGRSFEETLGTRFAEHLPAENRYDFNALIGAVCDNGQTQVCEVPLPGEDGRTRYFSIRLGSIKDGSETAFLMAIGTDVTAQRELEEELRRHQDELAHAARLSMAGELSTLIAHELNQPLTAIANYSGACMELLRSGSTETSSILSHMERLSSQAVRAGEVIRRLRGFVQKREPQRVVIDLNEIVEDTVPLLIAEAKHARVSVQLGLTEDLPPVVADRIQVQQVVLNLLKNAIDACADSEGTERIVAVETAAIGRERVEVIVSDTGSGLSQEDSAAIFEPFYTTKGEGMGLGLTICRTIVKAHGGNLFIQHGPADRTMFCFTLPVEDTREEP